MTAKFPGDCRRAGDLPAQFFREYIKHLGHGHDAAFKHSLAKWREELAKAAAKDRGPGLFGGEGKQ